jgi:glutamate racemase
MRIGFFDSGIGGLSVLHEALRQLPREDYLYYADDANVPYGNKSKEAIRCCVFEAVDFLANMDIKALVVACNTATSVAIQDIRIKYGFPIIGMEPAVKPAVKSVDGKRVLVFATPLTLRESKFIGLLNQVDVHNTVDYLPLQELVAFAEAYQFDRAVILSYLKERLKDYDLSRYGAVVLGCTHFPFFKNHIREVFPEGTVIVDGNRGTVQNLKNMLASLGMLNEGSGQVAYYRSGKRVSEDYTMERYLRLLRQIDNDNGGYPNSPGSGAIP